MSFRDLGLGWGFRKFQSLRCSYSHTLHNLNAFVIVIPWTIYPNPKYPDTEASISEFRLYLYTLHYSLQEPRHIDPEREFRNSYLNLETKRADQEITSVWGFGSQGSWVFFYGRPGFIEFCNLQGFMLPLGRGHLKYWSKILRWPGHVNRNFGYSATPQDVLRQDRSSRSKLLSSRCNDSQTVLVRMKDPQNYLPSFHLTRWLISGSRSVTIDRVPRSSEL